MQAKTPPRTESRPATPAPAKPTGPERFESEIRALEAAQRNRPVAPGSIVFIGSSSIKNWKTLAEDFPGFGCVNRGFGGSTLPEATHFAPRIVAPLRPRQVVLYSGDNDIAAGRSDRELLLAFLNFVSELRRLVPGVPITFLAIKPSPARIDRWPVARAANQRIANCCRLRDGLTFVDVATPMLRADGTPRPELYVSDRLHMTRAGYDLWTNVLRPHLLPPPAAGRTARAARGRNA